MTKRHWQDWVNGLLGVWIFISPWLLRRSMPGGGAPGEATMWNMWTVGVLVLAIAAIALLAYRAWEEWVNILLGAWLLVSPWLLGFSASTALMLNALIIGALVIFFAGWTLMNEQRSQQAAR